MHSGCRWIALAAAGMSLAWSALAQPQRPMRKGPGKVMRPAGRRPGIPPPGRKAPRAQDHRNMVDHLMTLPPEQQREFMQHDPGFQSLPPGQRQNIEKRLREFNDLPPGRREALRERFELFRQLSPEQQDHARALYRQWSQHPPARRQELMREFRQLREGSPEDRRRRLEGEEFRNRYTESEQELLRGLVDLLPASPE